MRGLAIAAVGCSDAGAPHFVRSLHRTWLLASRCYRTFQPRIECWIQPRKGLSDAIASSQVAPPKARKTRMTPAWVTITSLGDGACSSNHPPTRLAKASKDSPPGGVIVCQFAHHARQRGPSSASIASYVRPSHSPKSISRRRASVRTGTDQAAARSWANVAHLGRSELNNCPGRKGAASMASATASAPEMVVSMTVCPTHLPWRSTGG